MKRIVLLVLLSVVSLYINAQQITITVAGGGTSSSVNVPALQTSLSSPRIITGDKFGNIYVVEGRLVKKIDKFGEITDFAGGGSSYLDGIAATSAEIHGVHSLCATSSGDLLLAVNNMIRKIDVTTNLITTISGSSLSGYMGDGDFAFTARFNNLAHICVDTADNIFIADNGNGRVRKINASTARINTFCGNGSSTFAGSSFSGAATAASIGRPDFICTNKAGDVYFQSSGYIVRASHDTARLSICAGGGTTYVDCPASTVTFGTFSGICVVDTNDVCFNDERASCRRIDPVTDSVHYFAGDRSLGFKDDTNALASRMNISAGLFSDQKNSVFIADGANGRVRKVITVTSHPYFAYGNYRYFNSCLGSSTSLSDYLKITDIDVAQTETWSVISGPTHGTLSGFPVTVNSRGPLTTTKPSGVTFNANSVYQGLDTFYVRVTDGTSFDTMMVKVDTRERFTSTVIVGPDTVCANVGYPFGVSVSTGEPGLWSSTSGHISMPSYALASSYGRVVSAGFDTIVVLLPGGCGITKRKPIYVKPLPVLGPILGSDSVCPHSTVTYTDTTFGGTWASSARYGSMSASTGMYTAATGYTTDIITYSKTVGGCSSTVSKSIHINSHVTLIDFEPICIENTEWVFDPNTGSTWRLTNATAVFDFVSDSTALIRGVSAGYDTLIRVHYDSVCGWDSVVVPIAIYTPRALPPITGPDPICVSVTWRLTDGYTGGRWAVLDSNATINEYTGEITGLHTGTTVVEYGAYTDYCYTYTYDTINIIDTLPSPGTITGAPFFCRGSYDTMTATIAGGAWRTTSSTARVTSAGVVSGVTAGTAVITYTVSNVCGSRYTTTSILIDTVPEPQPILGPTHLCPGLGATYSISTHGPAWSLSNSRALVDSLGRLVAVFSGYDTLLHTDTNVCGSAVSSLPLFIDSLPSAGTITGGDSICMGSFRPYHSTVTGGVWHTLVGNAGLDTLGNLNGLFRGFDTIVYVVFGFCGTDTSFKQVYVNDLPDTGRIMGPSHLCLDSTATLTDTVVGGVWSTLVGNVTITSTGVVTGVTAGVDTVFYSTTNTCGTRHTKKAITVDSCWRTGIPLQSTYNEIEIFPNPATSVLHINVPNANGADISITDATGRVIPIEPEKVSNNELQLNLSNFASGVYMVKVSVGGQVLTSRAVLE